MSLRMGARFDLLRGFVIAVLLGGGWLGPAGAQEPETAPATGEEAGADNAVSLTASLEGETERESFGDAERARYDELIAMAPRWDTLESLELSQIEVALGKYDELIERLEPRLPMDPILADARPSRLTQMLLRALARSQLAVGRRVDALETYRHLGSQYGDLLAQARAGVLLEQAGDRQEAVAFFEGLIDAYNAAPRLNVDGYHAVAIACRQLGREEPALFQDALKAFDQAIEASRGREFGYPARIDLANLFLDKYDSGQARASLEPVLDQDAPSAEALLALARIERFDGQPSVRAIADQILERNPRHVDTLVLLATLETEAENGAAAVEWVDRALDVNPNHLPALTLSAGLALQDGNLLLFGQRQARVEELSPGNAAFWVELSKLAMRNRLYPQALDFAQRAVAADPLSWEGWSEVGMNQLRLGQIEDGRASLEKSFAGDPYNVWNKNTLDLLDSLVQYRTIPTRRFELILHQDEADLLAPLVAEIAERAYDSLASRYGFEPATPIRIEVYPRHEDFSVRTVGLSGLGALGVSFGPVIAMDSPAARGIGDFNWGTTLWHEIAHTFTLGLTRGRIPRWLTEGLSVYEERQGPEGWTDEPSPDFLSAYADGRLHGLTTINEGFVRPSFPNQIGLSYYQASLIAEFIEKEWGFEHIVGLLHGYRDGYDTERVFREQFGLTLQEFDDRFWSYLESRFETALPSFRSVSVSVEEEGAEEEDPLSQSPDAIELPSPSAEGDLEVAAETRPDDYRTQLAWGLELKRQERWEKADEVLSRARDLFPEYAGPGSPYHLLAEVALAREDNDAAIAHLQGLIDINEYDYDAHLQLAELYKERGAIESEADTLTRTLYIYPYRRTVHERLADLAVAADRPLDRIQALERVLALDPPSRPRVLFEIARSHEQLGDLEQARRAVLGALELAPGFPQAQDLLLDLLERMGDDS